MTAQNVLTKVGWEIGQDGTKLLFSTPNALVRQLIELMYAAGTDIARRTEWQNLHKTFDVVANLDKIALPADFRELQESGAIKLKPAVGTTGFKPARMIVAPEQWDLILSRPSAQTYCHLTGGKLHFAPNSGPEGAIVRYVSKYWNLNAQEGLNAADELFAIPEHLLVRGTVWRWRRQKGLEFSDLLAEYESDLIDAVSADRGVA